jgi:hypothetical protein
MSLKDLDARLVPRLAAALRSLLDGAEQRREAARGAARQRAQALVAAPSKGLLGRLDDRFASTGPLKLLRDVPQLGLLLVAAVFLAGTGAALALSEPEQVRQRQQARQEAALPLTLGPAVGDDIDAHFAAARERAVSLARAEPEGNYLALVSLNKGLTPEETGQLLQESGLQVRRAYLRAPVPGDPEQIVFQTPNDVVTGLQQVFSEIAARKAKEQQELLGTARTITSGTPEEVEFRELYEADARTAGQEAAAFRTGCACVFALVVEAEATELAELPALPVVRGVEVSPRGAELSALDVRPLPPTAKGVVPPPSTRTPSDGS